MRLIQGQPDNMVIPDKIFTHHYRSPTRQGFNRNQKGPYLPRELSGIQMDFSKKEVKEQKYIDPKYHITPQGHIIFWSRRQGYSVPIESICHVVYLSAMKTPRVGST